MWQWKILSDIWNIKSYRLSYLALIDNTIISINVASITGKCSAGYICEGGSIFAEPITGVDSTTGFYNGPCYPGQYCPEGTGGSSGMLCPIGTMRNNTLGKEESDCFNCRPVCSWKNIFIVLFCDNFFIFNSRDTTVIRMRWLNQLLNVLEDIIALALHLMLTLTNIHVMLDTTVH